MQTCDVLIVGGGPAGSSCAWKLRRAGVDVIVLDKSQFPRDKVCAGWITPPVMKELGFSADEYRLEGTLQPITRFLTGLIGEHEVETNYGRIVSYGIRRCEFDHFLLRRANAQLRLGEAFRSLRQEDNCWVVNDEFRTPVLVGAGGHFCPVARWGRESNHSAQNSELTPSTNCPTVVAQEVEIEMTESDMRQCSVLHDRPELFFCRDLKGYGWVFRKDNFLNIGLGREEETSLSRHVTEFIRTLVAHGKIPADLRAHFHGHAYRLRSVLPPRSKSNLLLIGDSAGLAERYSGEGIRPAIESGLIAAQCIIETQGNGRAELGERFAAKLRQRFGESDSESFITRVPEPLRRFAARWLMTSHLFARRVLLDRWFLNSSLPPLPE